MFWKRRMPSYSEMEISTPPRRYIEVETKDLESWLSTSSLAPPFALLLAWDAAGAPDELIARIADRLLALGMVMFFAWGADSTRVLNAVEVACVRANPKETDSNVIFTFAPKKSLRKTLWEFAYFIEPADEYVAATQTWIAVSVANTRWGRTIRRFVRRMNAVQ